MPSGPPAKRITDVRVSSTTLISSSNLCVGLSESMSNVARVQSPGIILRRGHRCLYLGRYNDVRGKIRLCKRTSNNSLLQ